MSRPKLSVIVTTHNRADLLPRALHSLRALGEGVQIVLCADEGSRETRRVAAEHLREGDIFLNVPGMRGPAGSRNIGLQYAAGDWMAFLDDDDTMDPILGHGFIDGLEGDCVWYTDYRKVFETRADEVCEVRRVHKATSRKPVSDLQIRNFLGNSSFFFPRRLAPEVRFDMDLTMSEDWEFLLQLYERVPFRHVEVTGSNWHIAENSRNGGSKKERARSYLKICALHPAATDDIRAARKARLAELGVDADEEQL